MSADLSAGGMAAAMLDQEMQFARTGAFANRVTNTSLYSFCRRSTYTIQYAEALAANKLARGLPLKLVLGEQASPVSTLGPAIDSRRAVREKDSFQCSQDEYISPRWQLLKLYGLYNLQHDFKSLPSCICYSSIYRISQRPGSLFQRFCSPSS